MPKNPHANFRPTLESYSGQGAFRFWCQMALPLTYDDSLSYYELLNKVVTYLNNTIEDVGKVEDNVAALNEAYGKLEDYVNTYFDEIDIEAELRNVLDAMAEDGSLDSLLDPLVAARLGDVVAEQISGVVANQIDGAVSEQIGGAVLENLPAVVPDAVNEWLDNNVTPTTPIVDKTLIISGAAADAKVTGDRITDLKNAFSSAFDYEYSKNRFNGTMTAGGLIVQTTGAVSEASTHSYSDWIDISNHGTENVVFSNTPSTSATYTNLRYAFYDASKTFISGGIAPTKENDTTLNRDYAVITTPANAAYMRFSVPTSWLSATDKVQIEYGQITNYSEYKGDIPILKNASLENNSVFRNSQERFFSKNRNNGITYAGGFINQFNGNVDSQSTSTYSDWIDISNHADSDVVISASANTSWSYANLRWAFYDADKAFISGGIAPMKNTDTDLNRDYGIIAAPSNAAYMRFSQPTGWFNAVSDIQIEYDTPTEYTRYVDDISALEVSDQLIIPKSMTYGISPSRAKADAFSNDETLIVESNSVMKNQNISFFGKISGSFGSVAVGHGQGSYGYYITVDGEKMSYCSNGSVGSSVAHGLTIEEFIGVTVEVDVALNVTVTITTKGGYFKKTVQINSSWRGNVFATSTNTSFTDAVLSWNSDDYKCPLWAFGDSYFTLYSPARWPYYVAREWGYNNILLNAYPGEDSAGGYADLINALKHGTPKYLLWCLGMNDKDQASAPNATWLSKVESIIEICKQKNITLILCTIPTVTSASTKNTEKNAWIKNSGIRYVDLADAIADVDGWLSSDGTHPSEIGGRFIALKMLADVPELMQGK